MKNQQLSVSFTDHCKPFTIGGKKVSFSEKGVFFLIDQVFLECALNEKYLLAFCHPKALNNHPLKEFSDKVALYVHSSS
jgi:hypothetical protein